MSGRKLASIRRIKEIRPIEGADKIELAIIDGWQVVVKKGDFSADDLCIYFEIDSLLPEVEEFEFLRKNCFVTNTTTRPGFRLKTIRLRGEVSQGLALPIIKLDDQAGGYYNSIRAARHPNEEENWPILLNDDRPYIMVDEGDDITSMLDVEKYEKPIPANLAGKIRGNFPSFIRKTDQERIQNLDINKLLNHTYEVTIKLDGSSFTAYYDKENDRFGVCSRNLDLEETEDNSFWIAARKYNLEEKLRQFNESIAIQGELMGPGVQGNREQLADLDIFVFDIWDIEYQRYWAPEERTRITKVLGLNHVPVLHENFDIGNMSTVNVLEMADGPSLNNSVREGIVFKSHEDSMVSFKAISNQFLMEGGD